MEIETLKQKFYTVYNKYIAPREGADKLLKWLEDTDFFTAPASTRYHGSYEGGLLEHSINVYNELIKEWCYALSGAYEQYPLAVCLHIADMRASYLIESRGN